MRISDWSSDVCSSDLGRIADQRENPLVAHRLHGIEVRCLSDEGSRIELPVAGMHHGAGAAAQDDGTRLGDRVGLADQLNLERADGEVAAHRHHAQVDLGQQPGRSEEHTSELQSLMRISYAAFCLKTKNQTM